jgi:hypothetical protein
MKYESNLINTSLLIPIEQYLFPITHDINDLKIELENKNKIIYDLTIENKDINFIYKIQLEDKNKIIHEQRLTLINKNKDINILKIKLENKFNKCSICLDNIISHCCVPCGHAYCYDCINKTSNCYICRGIIQNKIKLYLF